MAFSPHKAFNSLLILHFTWYKYYKFPLILIKRRVFAMQIFLVRRCDIRRLRIIRHPRNR